MPIENYRIVAVDLAVPRKLQIGYFSEVRVTGSPASVPMLIRDPAIFQHPRFVYVRRKK
jgi:hypothetical protein